ncbi:MAG: hypothetical protein E7589_07085 [Ruminococcaceae bacterium]|nr:hypothetical protein [Oscillospiraceae bacterium]
MSNEIKKPRIILRALIIFSVLAILLVAVQYLSYHHYADVAEWKTAESREALVYNGEEYLLSGKYATAALSSSKYKLQKTEGELKIEGIWESFKGVILVSSIENYEDLIVVTYENGDRYVYYKNGTDNPVKPKTDTEGIG